MNQGLQPDVLIFHGPNCLDGLGCVWAVKQRWPNVGAWAGIYGEPPPEGIKGLRVLIADFSYPEDVLREMAAKALEVTVLDHHASAETTLRKLLNENVIKGEYDATRSGAALAWEYAWGNRHPPKLLEHVQDRDLWKFEIPGTREVTAVLATLGADMQAWTDLAKRLEGGMGVRVVEEGAAILRARDDDMASVIRAGQRTMVIGGHAVPVVNAPFFWASDIGHTLGDGAPFAATYMDMADGRHFSLRSDKDGLEVHKIAEEYGGGGHPHAAGFTVPLGWEGDADEPPAKED